MLDFFLFGISFILSFISTVTAASIDITEELPWDVGSHYVYGWILLIIILGFSVFLNGFSLILIIFVKRVRNTAMAHILFSLNCVDFLMSMGCLLQCIINLHHLELFGHNIGCELQAFQVGFFTFWEASVLALLAYAMERQVCAGITFGNLHIFKMVMLAAVLSLILTICVLYLPHGGYHLYASGLYCFIDTSTPLGGLGFAMGVITPTVIMAHRYYRIWRGVSDAQSLLKTKGIETKAKARYAHMAKKMALFIVSFFGCAIPFLVTSLYEIATWKYAPPLLDVVSGNAIHTSSVINPLLFYMLNDDAREALWSIFGVYITACCCCFSKSLKVTPRVAEQKANVTRIISYSVGSTDEWKLWLTDKKYAPLFRNWCEANFVTENFLFYHDVEQHNLIAKKVYFKILQLIELRRSNNNTNISDEITTLWKQDLHNSISQLYEMYIQIPSAPLEVNIACSTRQRIETVLGIVISTKNKNDKKAPTVPELPDIWEMSEVEAKNKLEDIIHLFDESFHTISHIIATDIFPRFQKSSTYVAEMVDCSYHIKSNATDSATHLTSLKV